MFNFVECAHTNSGPTELPGTHAQAGSFLSQDPQVQVDDSRCLNSELKEQVAVAERRNALLCG